MFIKFFFALTLYTTTAAATGEYNTSQIGCSRVPYFEKKKNKKNSGILLCQRVALCLAAVTLIETQTFAHRSTERSKKYFFPGHSFFFFQIGTQWPWIDSSRGYTRVEREKRHSSGLWQYIHVWKLKK